MPAGGIAAALIVGDRRFISDRIYDLFRASGLAHLLAISGLHMGLLCFGCMAALRFFAALFPKMASRMAVHKYAALISVLIGLIYAILSGTSVSAVRACIMELLVIFAVLIDRRALTIRNVALAAFVILAINPVAVFGAGFQLSFAATAVLVMAYEKSLYRPPARRHRIIGYLIGIFAASVLANFATAPFTAQYFGSDRNRGIFRQIAICRYRVITARLCGADAFGGWHCCFLYIGKAHALGRVGAAHIGDLVVDHETGA